MKILFCASHFGFLRNFEHGLAELARRGHHIHLLADRRENMGGSRTIDNLQAAYPNSFTWSFAANAKSHPWHALGNALRLTLDYWRYLDPRYAQAGALRARAAEQVPGAAVSLGHALGAAGVKVVRPLVRACERAIPPSPHAFQAIDAHQPDVVVITPMLYFGSQQVDYVRAARQRGVPVMLSVGSWDHLTTKGLIHDVPDRVTVWNDAQRREAAELHAVPPALVRVTGAQSYDHWFTTAPSLTREQFCAQAGLPVDRPYLLYLCSSPFIAPREVDFVRRWIAGIRAHADPVLRTVGVLIRPHPQNAEQWKEVDLSGDGAAAVWPRAGSNPVDRDARADYFNSMFHSDAVVGVNTSAQIEAGIVGRPVFAVKGEEFAGTQEGTLHFQHLKNVNGGLLWTSESFEQHYQQLVEMLSSSDKFAHRGRAFIEAFIRPHGLTQPAAPFLANAVEELASEGRRKSIGPSLAAKMLRPVLYPAALVAQRARRARRAAPTPDSGDSRRLRLLFVLGSPEYLRFFDETIRALASRGNQVLVAVNQQKDLKPARFEAFAASQPGVTFVGLLPRRGDQWSALARAVRGTMDFLRYLDPRFEGTPALRARMKRKVLPRALRWIDHATTLPASVLSASLRLLATIERAIPPSHRVIHSIQQLGVDGVLVSPLVDAASEQVDTVRAAHRLGLPVGACIASWDNLTNKGLLRVQPDFVTVWNDLQAKEAHDYHGIAPDRVMVTGAQPFDRWFEKAPSRSRDAFCSMLGFDPARPIVLFTGSSFFISGVDSELPFVERWMRALRVAPAEAVAQANILIRPHPYNADQWTDADVTPFGRATVWPRGRHNPTDEQNRSDFFDSLYHADAIVGVNTSAMIEAAILRRPVHAILTSDFAGTQEGTIHFRYLLPENGGFLRVARSLDDHVTALAHSLADLDRVRAETTHFVSAFLRPRGLDQPAVAMLADAIERGTRAGHLPVRDGFWAMTIRLAVLPAVGLRPAVMVIRQRLFGRQARKDARLQLHRVRKRATKAARQTAHRVSRGPHAAGQTGRGLVRGATTTGQRISKNTMRAWRRVRYEVAMRLKHSADSSAPRR